jgi:hypothetical protein
VIATVSKFHAYRIRILVPDRISLEVTMNQDEQLQAEADAAEIARLVAEEERVTDTELLHRIRRRSDALRRETLQTQGWTEIAVDPIRESRDEWLHM